MRITPLHQWIGAAIGCSADGFTREQLEHYQFEKLQWVLRYTLEHSPFYQKLYSNSPKTIQSLPDLSSLPFTTAEDIRENPNRFICVPQEDIQRIVTLPTSGTTGVSKRLFFTAADQELTIDFFKTGMSTLAAAGDRVLILLPGQRPGSVGDLLKTGLERLGCSPFVYGPVDDEELVFKVIIEQDINVLVGAPVHLHRLARIDDEEWVLPKNQIHKVLVSTDTLAHTVRSNLQSIWGCEVFDHYGMTETGLGGGVECDAHHGFHLREADLYFEIVDPESGYPLPEGELGEVVVTTLNRTGMPLIRYRTGDLSRLIPGTCTCGSFIKRLDRIINRTNAGIQLDSGLLTQQALDEALFQIRDVVDFSVAYMESKEKRFLQLAVRTINGQLKKIENDLFESLVQIPALQTELESGGLDLEFVPLEKTLLGNPNAMYKRKIIRGAIE